MSIKPPFVQEISCKITMRKGLYTRSFLKRLNIDFNAINCAKGKLLLSTTWAVRDDEKLLVDDRVFLGTSVYEGRRKVLQGWLVPPGEPIVRNTLIKNPFPGSVL